VTTTSATVQKWVPEERRYYSHMFVISIRSGTPEKVFDTIKSEYAVSLRASQVFSFINSRGYYIEY